MSVHDYNDKTPREHLAGVLGTVPTVRIHSNYDAIRALAVGGEKKLAKSVDLRCANCGHPPVEHYAGRGYCHKCPSEAACPSWEPKTKEAQDAVRGRSNE